MLLKKLKEMANCPDEKHNIRSRFSVVYICCFSATMPHMSTDLKAKTFEQVEQVVSELGGKAYLAKYIFSFIHAQDARSIDDITPLSKDFRQKLKDAGFYISRLKTVEKFIDPDGTIKYLFELPDGIRIESVLLTNDGPGSRKTLCISCQAGCRMGCDFCATAKIGFSRNLTAAEIADQVNIICEDSGKINNVVYMGMGEPLDNYDNVIDSVKIINHHAGKFIGQRHITVSTCGITKGIDRLSEETILPRLAISLHASNDKLRKKLMPIANKYPLKELLSCLKAYQLKTKKRITFEYCMIKHLNDTSSHARELTKLLCELKASVNLIEYNTHPNCDLCPSNKIVIQKFQDILMKSGIETVIRFKRGQKIKAACGQLGATWLKG
jgi:23S rRNA (adenine2503-C2)-methyltransferase